MFRAGLRKWNLLGPIRRSDGTQTRQTYLPPGHLATAAERTPPRTAAALDRSVERGTTDGERDREDHGSRAAQDGCQPAPTQPPLADADQLLDVQVGRANVCRSPAASAPRASALVAVRAVMHSGWTPV
jgi:hypothetical protein